MAISHMRTVSWAIVVMAKEGPLPVQTNESVVPYFKNIYSVYIH